MYAFAGEVIKEKVVVRDLNGVSDITDVDIRVNGEIESSCREVSIKGKKTDLSGFVPGGFNPSTDKVFECTLTVEPQWYGTLDVNIYVTTPTEVTQRMGVAQKWFFNPAISLEVDTNDGMPIWFENGPEGTTVYSGNKVFVSNSAEGGVNMWIFIAGTDLYGIGPAVCPVNNEIDIEKYMDFRGNTGTILGPWKDMSRYDQNEGCTSEFCYGGVPVPGAIIEKAGDFSNRLGNLLTNGGSLEIEFRLTYPTPCTGDFTSGQIFIFGKSV
jgi:hypothetical protein